MYSKYRLDNLIVLVGLTKIKTIISYIDAGYSDIKDIADRYNITQKHAWMIYSLHNRPDPVSKEIIGSKLTSYYDVEDPVIGPYIITDLKDAEKEIAEKDTSTKLWTWEE